MTPLREDPQAWMDRVSTREWVWYVKYLASNDTYAKPNVHQAGPYLSKPLLAECFHTLSKRANVDRDPRFAIPVHVASHDNDLDVNVIWYNSKRLPRRPGKRDDRDEARMTGWKSKMHPVVEPNATGTLAVFAFRRVAGGDPDACEVWLCEGLEQQEVVFGRVGPVEPARGVLFLPGRGTIEEPAEGSCLMSDDDMQPEWRSSFPTGEEILEIALRRLPTSQALEVDARLITRRDCEFSLFLGIERFVVLPTVNKGFTDVESFVFFANQITNRRRSRSGKSLELHLRRIFFEEKLANSWGQTTEDNHVPDFVFPSIERYRDARWPAAKLRMLAAKTTCKDRWRQILSEADRIPRKHLLTLQQGMSEAQFREIDKAKVQLVVPKNLHRAYPESVRGKLLTVKQFISETTAL